MTPDQMRERLEQRLLATHSDMQDAERYYTGTQPLGFIAPEQLAVIKDRVKPLSVNLCRLAVDTLAQRLMVTGFRSSPGETVDEDLVKLWQSLGLDESAQMAQNDALVFGRSYFLAWADAEGNPTVTAESPFQVCVERDPVTRRVIAALKRWRDAEGYTRSLLLTAETITEYASRSATPDPTGTTATYLVLTDDSMRVREDVNTLGVVPVVPLVNRPRLSHPDGESDLADLMGLVQAIGKVGSDMMVASEYAGSPKRWVTGIAPGGDISQDQMNEVRDRLKEEWEAARNSKFVTASHEATKFGTFDQADMTGFDMAIKLLTGQVGALACLPPYFTDNGAVNPTSADAIRAGESRLTAKAKQRQRWWSGPYEDLMRLVVLIRDGQPDARLDDLETLWLDPEPATVAQTADAQSKLLTSGIVDRRAALEALGKTPLEIDRILATSDPAGAIA